MSTTACWATNEDFDCAWVYFGYGSCHDMMCSPGYWISLRGLCAIAEYDYDLSIHSPYLDLSNPKHRLEVEKLGIDVEDARHVEIPEELVSKLPLDIQMDLSPITIKHPQGLEKSLEWYVEVLKHAGKYYKQGYKEIKCYQNASSGFSTYTHCLPSLEKIKDLNPLHYEWHKNLEAREAVLIEEMRFKPDPYASCRATSEDIKEMLDGWQKEEDERYEEFKKKNIFGQL